MSLVVRSLSAPSGRMGMHPATFKRSATVFVDSYKRQRVSTPQEKMQNNFLEAIREHGLDPQLLPRIGLEAPKSLLYLNCSTQSVKGPVRPTMEDAHFDCELPDGHLVGIFDGHGENGRIARFASQIFQREFQPALEKNPNDIRKVFIDLCKKVQIAIKDVLKDYSGGATALVSYFHSASNRFYTATLGDSEMRIYRKAGDIITSIPVSLVRDWCSKKDEARFLSVIKDVPSVIRPLENTGPKVINGSVVKNNWLAQKNAKFRRFPPTIPGFTVGGINTARSLGDLRMVWEDLSQGPPFRTAVSHIPKVSMCQAVYEEDIEDKVVFACDGLWDFAKEEELIEKVLKPHWDNPQLADLIVDYAINTAKSQDNVTVMVGSFSNEAPSAYPVTRPVSPVDADPEVIIASISED